jgi:GDP-L-fucose synthase
VSISELAQTVSATVGFKGDIAFDTSKPDGTPRKLMDVSKLHALGFNHNTTLEQGLQTAYADFLEKNGFLNKTRHH